MEIQVKQSGPNSGSNWVMGTQEFITSFSSNVRTLHNKKFKKKPR